ncbi:hypothetical protein AQUCO_00200908v1 [Aquilegia coerulea]|uniref:Sulfotransferase n=1 Tax=Aquilegia coerulea TaxID=218851 RepID=A0A2G5F5G5_AQUCA|nr:hypothetical protein AQUCO_00200908v1 [Aquilegia coerulea]
MEDAFGVLNATFDSPNISALLSQLPTAKWWDKYDLYQWEGSWYAPAQIESALAVQSKFEARDDDVIITSSLKTGTTWLKALVSSILNEYNNDDEQDPLTTQNPHSIVKSLEGHVYLHNPNVDLSYSIKKSKCKIVYITRNPKDTFVSLWHFLNAMNPEDQELYPFDQAFEDFCKGFHYFGPYHDHVLEYWNISLKFPEKIHFLKYEDLKIDPKEKLMKLGEFLEKPFPNDQRVDRLLWRCSIERLQNLEVNISGTSPFGVANSSFFRLGIVGDWKNCFTKEMSERLDHITRSKFEGSGLHLDI